MFNLEYVLKLKLIRFVDLLDGGCEKELEIKGDFKICGLCYWWLVILFFVIKNFKKSRFVAENREFGILDI